VNEFGLRGGFVVALSLAGFAAALWRHADRWPRAGRLALYAGAVLCVLAALPTSAIDLWNSRNLEDPRFITYVSPREAEALLWLRRNLPESAVVQGLVQHRLENHRSHGRMANLLGSLGGRRMASGNGYYAGQFQIGTRAAEQRVRAVERIFRGGPLERRLTPLLELRIDYLVVGHDERHAPHTDPALYPARPDLFTPVHDNQEVTVYRVEAAAIRRELASLAATRPAAGRAS
jgi:hypothetical protein